MLFRPGSPRILTHLHMQKTFIWLDTRLRKLRYSSTRFTKYSVIEITWSLQSIFIKRSITYGISSRETKRWRTGMHPNSFSPSSRCLPGTCYTDHMQNRHCFHHRSFLDVKNEKHSQARSDARATTVILWKEWTWEIQKKHWTCDNIAKIYISKCSYQDKGLINRGPCVKYHKQGSIH